MTQTTRTAPRSVPFFERLFSNADDHAALSSAPRFDACSLSNAHGRAGFPWSARDMMAIAVAAVIAFALKKHYSVASADDLWWILAPTAAVIERLTGHAFVLELSVGYLSRELHFVIVPSCAGVNFMIVWIAAASVGLVSRFDTLRTKVTWVLCSVGVGYLAAIGVNSIRIIGALFIHKHHLVVGSLSPEALHRVEGIVVYFSCLCALYLLADHRLGAHARRKGRA